MSAKQVLFGCWRSSRETTQFRSSLTYQNVIPIHVHCTELWNLSSIITHDLELELHAVKPNVDCCPYSLTSWNGVGVYNQTLFTSASVKVKFELDDTGLVGDSLSSSKASQENPGPLCPCKSPWNWVICISDRKLLGLICLYQRTVN